MASRSFGWVRPEKDHRDWQYMVPRRVLVALPSSADLSSGMGPLLDQGDEGSCHDDRTEVLTEHGWKRFADVAAIERLACVNPATSQLHFHRPIKLISYHYSGQLYYGKHSSLDFAVTPDHKMLVREWDESRGTLSSDYQLIKMQDVGRHTGLMQNVNYSGTGPLDIYMIPGVGHQNRPQRSQVELPMKAWLRFLGLYLAGGTMSGRRPKQNNLKQNNLKENNHDCSVAIMPSTATRYKVQIAAVTDREKDFARQALIGIGVAAHERVDRFQFKNKGIVKALEALGLRGAKASQKFVPAFVFEQSADNIREFLLGFFIGDGYRVHNGRAFSTSSKQLADDLQRLVFLAGGTSKLSVLCGRPVTSRHPEYRVSWHDGCGLSIDRQANVTTSHYDGNVYCAEMPVHHTLVTRRNGKVLVSGNCGPNSLSEIISFDQKVENIAVVPPSRQFMYWITRVLMGTTDQDSGVDNRTMLKAVAAGGFCPESMWPYDTHNLTTQPAQSCFTAAKQNAISNYATVQQTPEQMKGTIVTGRPFLFGFTVYQGIEGDQAARTGVVPDPNPGESAIGGHDVTFVGFSDNGYGKIPGGAFKFRNHWTNGDGSPWGDGGYGYLSYKYAFDPNQAGDFWVINAIPGQAPTPPPVPVPIPPPSPPPAPPAPPPAPAPAGPTAAQVNAALQAEYGHDFGNWIQTYSRYREVNPVSLLRMVEAAVMLRSKAVVDALFRGH